MKIIDILVDDSNEDSQLRLVAEDHDYAIVYRKGHEFIDRVAFVNEIDKHNFFIMGHILDRENMNAYYELHTQCYVINLKIYKAMDYPIVGQQAFHASHQQLSPERSDENYHDDYTPWWVRPGKRTKHYTHKPHGWNILSIAFNHDLPVIVFNSILRKTKKFNYEFNS